jgi:hypothetical protein
VYVVPATVVPDILVNGPAACAPRYTLYPATPLDVLAVQFNTVECEVVDAVPVPLNAIVAGVFDALLTSDRLPVTLPAVVGA